ncbi:MAG TPA: pilus assembly protein TadG-related protein [Pseudoflavonifractor sp.]|nr:pilus assembly protein TadG-related protein [Pseudoflavonifractor sp.]
MTGSFLHRLGREEGGSVLVLVAGFMTAALLLGALAVDLGCLYVRGGQVQTAADAAVLAAGRLLPIASNDTAGKQKIAAIAAEYLQKNGSYPLEDYEFYFDGPKSRCGGSSNLTTFGVKIKGTVLTSFAPVIGVYALSFTKTAEVQSMVCVRLSDVVPLGVERAKLSACLAAGIREHITLKYGAKGGNTLPSGSFGAIDLDGVKGGGANDFRTWLTYGYSGQLAVGSVLPVESGNMAGPTSQAFTSRYSQCTHFPGQGGCTAQHYVSSCPRVIKVPVVEYEGKKNVRIVGFAAFVLEGQPPGMSDAITGSYVDMVTLGSAGGDATGKSENFGVYSLMLSK